jgi:type VI secretion system protein ImpC
MARIAASLGAPFIAAAADRLLGCESLAATPDPAQWEPAGDDDDRAAWEHLRCLPEARFVGLALPGFLLRLPYGADTDPIEAFEFEELSRPLPHRELLWTHPAFACACLLGEAFSRMGWDMQPGSCQDIERLPLLSYTSDKGPAVYPCAETLLTETAAEAILDRGIMPLISFREQDRIRLLRLQSVASPPAALAGRWG